MGKATPNMLEFAQRIANELDLDLPTNFLLLVGAALIWPITVPLAVGTALLLCLAWLARTLAGK